jgi:hypothetical protein
MRGCQPGKPLKSRMRAQTFSIGASMTLEILIFGTESSLDAAEQDSARPERALINAS